MGKGIALEFKNRFPEMFAEYARYCAEKRLLPGVLHLWKKSKPWILNFPTKNHWKFPSKIEYIEKGLDKFAGTYSAHGITFIAFPELGTSSGGLLWDEVRLVMYRYLETMHNLEVEIYHYDSDAKDSLFDKLYQRIHRFGIADYKTYLGMNTKQANRLSEAINARAVHNMHDLQELDGIGEKCIEKLYKFAEAAAESRRLVTHREHQPNLPF